LQMRAEIGGCSAPRARVRQAAQPTTGA
jgi:hypothetical protein